MSEVTGGELLIAVGIGLHNFAEGLAIGQSAASGDIALATLLVIGFGLHNATEGFGIVAPLAADETAERPSWAFLGLLGLGWRLTGNGGFLDLERERPRLGVGAEGRVLQHEVVEIRK